MRVELPDRREMYNGFGDTLARAFELVLTPAIFAGLGYLLDGAVGTRPLFMVTFFVVAFVALSWRMWMEYDQRMRSMEEKMGLKRRGGMQ